MLRVALGGIVDGQGELTVDAAGALSTERGVLRGAGRLRIAEGGAWVVTNLANSAVTVERSVENRGVIQGDGPGSINFNGATVANLLTGSLRLDHGLALFGGNSGVVNLGEIRLTGADTIRWQGLGLVQRGRWIAPESSVEVNGATLEFGAGGTTILGRDLKVTGAEMTVDHAPAVQGAVSWTATMTHLGTDVELPQLSLNGVIDGDGDLTILSHFDWRGGNMGGAGELRLPAGATADLQSTLRLGRHWINDGQVTCEPSLSLILENVTIENRGQFQCGTTTFSWRQVADDNRFLNTGTLIKDTAGVLAFERTRLVQRGQVRFLAGEVRWNGGADVESSVDLPPGARLRLAIDTTLAAGATLGGAGSFDFEAGEHNLAGRFLPTGTFHVGQNAVVTVHNPLPTTAGADIQIGTLFLDTDQVIRDLSLHSGTVAGSTRLTVTEAFTWDLGRLDAGPPLTIASNASLQVTGRNNVLARDLLNQGDMTVADSAEIWFENSSLTNIGVLHLPGVAGFT